MPKDTPPADNSDGNDGSIDQGTTDTEIRPASITPQFLTVTGTHGIAKWEIHSTAFKQCVVEIEPTNGGVALVMDGLAGNNRAGATAHLSEKQAREIAEVLETLTTPPEEKHD